MDIIEIGTPALDPYGNHGFVSEVKASSGNVHVLGAGGLQLVRHEYEVCWSNGRISIMSDGILSPCLQRAARANLPKIDDVQTCRAAIAEMEQAHRAEEKAEVDKAKERALAFQAEAAERMPSWAKAVIVAELVQDQSDSQSDYYGSTTKRRVILGFSKHTRDLFPELRAAAATFGETESLATADAKAEHREKYSMGAGYYLKAGGRDSNGWKVSKSGLYQGAKSIPEGEWLTPVEAPKAEPVAISSTASAGFRIEEHTHTKHGFQMFIAIMPDRVSREEFDRLNNAAKALGGWYSKPWGRTPGGFAFKVRDRAAEFVNTFSPHADIAATPVATPAVAAPSANAGLAEKFRTAADRLQAEIDGKFASRLSNTPKRQREADSARLDGWHLTRTQNALRVLADMHDAGTVPPVLATLKTKADVHALTRSVIDRSRGGYYDAGTDTETPAVDSKQARALWGLLKGKSDDQRKAESLRLKIQALQFARIPGYFPTPADIVTRMLDLAEIPDDACSVLEPSAGSGAIADAVLERFPNVELSVIEDHHTLREILELKRHRLFGSDFMAVQADPIFDFVLMNPPFENGQDAEHIMHAYRFLKPGGRLVAIMSPGPFYRQDRKAVAFREWFERNAESKDDIPAGAFKESGTGVATVLVVLDA